MSIGLFTICLTLAGCGDGSSPTPPLAKAEAAFAAGRYAEAEGAAVGVLKSDVDDETISRAVEIAALSALAVDRTERAFSVLEKNAKHVPETMLSRYAALLQKQGRLTDAVAEYRRAVAAKPGDLDTREAFAKLLGMVGLRDEAVPHVLAVATQRETDLLMLTALESSLIRDEETLNRAIEATTVGGRPTDPLPLYGLAAIMAADGNSEEAERLLRESLEANGDFAPALNRLGRVLAERGDTDALVAWGQSLARLPQTADGWIAAGRLAELSEDADAAVAAYTRAAQLRPESREAVSRLAASLNSAARVEEAAKVAEFIPAMQRLRDTQSQVLFSNEQRNPADLVNLVNAYADAGREEEAYAWGQVALAIEAGGTELRERLGKMSTGGDLLVAKRRRPAADIEADVDAVRSMLASLHGDWSKDKESAARTVRLRDIAAEASVAFRYQNAEGSPPTLKMYEFAGGGVAAADFDGDARCDLFFTQAGTRPPGGTPDGDRLLRNRNGRGVDVTQDAFLQEAEYGQGVAAGDYDADGFADIYVANLGPNVLWRNLGDGTFERVLTTEEAVWTTSCLMADVTGDGVVDLFDVNYLKGDDLLTRVCKASDGGPSVCRPFDFEGEPDSLRTGDGSGGFTAEQDRLEAAEPGKGLGVLAFRDVDRPTPSVFVANDLTPNNLYVSQGGVLRDEAILRGVAVNGSGKAEGCMGIAAADVNGDGRVDLHVTNFLAESNTLFVSAAGDTYADRTAERGLDRPTLDLLGFGTQFFDADADGRQELFVANGHLQDLSRLGRPFKMPPQLFAVAGARFAEISADAGPFFQDTTIGRSAAVLDWDGDGREEVVVTHIDRPAGMLTADESTNRAVRIDFVGVSADRTGVGVLASAVVEGRMMLRTVTAGGGYMAENEHAVTFGLSDANSLETLAIKWPSGETQTFSDVAAGHWRLIEGGRIRRLLDGPASGK